MQEVANRSNKHHAVGWRALARVAVVFAVAASIGVHAVFSDLLKVPLPGGVLEP